MVEEPKGAFSFLFGSKQSQKAKTIQSMDLEDLQDWVESAGDE